MIVAALQSFSGKAAVRSQRGSWCSPVLTNPCRNSSTDCSSCEPSSFERERGIPPAHPNTAPEKGTGLIQPLIPASHNSLLQREHPFFPCSLLLKSPSSLIHSLTRWGLRSLLFVRAFCAFFFKRSPDACAVRSAHVCKQKPLCC